jgi:hypothetical protein
LIEIDEKVIERFRTDGQPDERVADASGTAL